MAACGSRERFPLKRTSRERGWGQHPVGVSTSDFDGERASIEGGGVREQGAFPVEENLNGEDVALCQL